MGAKGRLGVDSGREKNKKTLYGRKASGGMLMGGRERRQKRDPAKKNNLERAREI